MAIEGRLRAKQGGLGICYLNSAALICVYTGEMQLHSITMDGYLVKEQQYVAKEKECLQLV